MAVSLLAYWIGGASSPPGAAASGGVRSLLAFWAGGATSGTVLPPPSATEFYSGGWEHHPWLRRRKQYVEEQEIPQDVEEAIVASVARIPEVRSAARTAAAAQTAHAAAERSLRDYLNEQKQAWKNEYAQLIRLEYERREQEYEDAQIALMLFEM